MKQRITIMALIALAVSIADTAKAQGPPPPPPLNEVPLDGMSALLIASGAAYAGRKLLRTKDSA